jgi:hypothetical protein
MHNFMRNKRMLMVIYIIIYRKVSLYSKRRMFPESVVVIIM